MTTPDEDVTADDVERERDTPLTTDPEQQEALVEGDPNAGEGGAG